MYIPKSICGSILISYTNRVLIVQGRSTGKWSFPKGHRNPGESMFECAARETYEETGILLTPYFKQMHILSTGVYYEFLTNEQNFQINDVQEITEVAWVPINKLQNYPINVDIKTFLHKYNQNVQKTCPLPPIPKALLQV